MLRRLLPDAPSQRLALWLLLLTAMALRLGWGLSRPTDAESLDKLPDQREYLVLARNLLHGQGLKFVDERFGDEVLAFRVPGYPLLIAACGGSVRVVRAVQALLDTATVLAAYLLARQWLHAGPSLLAAALVGFNPFLIYFTGLILTETVFTTMLVWGMLLLVSSPAGEGPTWRGTFAWLAGGLLLALSVLVRQSALPLPILLAVSAAIANRHRGAPYHRRWPLPVGATILLLTLLVLFPWAYRNWRVLDQWVWTTTNGGITAYDGLNPDATGASDQSFVRSMPELRTMNEVDRSRHLGELAADFARQHPRRAAELGLIKAGRTWSPVPLSDEYRGAKYWVVGLAYSLPFDLLVILGLTTGRLSRSVKVFLLLPAIYFTAIHMLSVGSLRYRIPVEPPMAVVAASAAALPAAAGWKRAHLVASPSPVK